MGDNARPHRAHIVTDFLHQEAVTTLPWPAKSPDLNPIEMFWDMMGRRVREREPPVQNLAELEQTAPGMKHNTSVSDATSRTVDGEEGPGRYRRRRKLTPVNECLGSQF